MTTKKLGKITEMQCQVELMKLGCSVSVPLGDDDRYDFIIDYNGKLYKVQAKTSHETNYGSYEFSTRCVRYNSKGYYTTTYNEEQIDFFSTMINNECYLIPVSECGKKSKALRFEPKKNNQPISDNTNALFYKAEVQLQKL